MKEKTIAQLKNKYANLGLGEKAFNGVAEFLINSKTITTESDIENAVAGDMVKSLLQSIQGETDVLRTAHAKAQKDFDDYKKKFPDNKPDVNSELLTKINEMFAKQTELEKKLTESEAKVKTQNIISKVTEILKSQGCTNDFIRETTLTGITVSESDTAESLAEKYKPMYDANYKKAFGASPVPPHGNGGNGEGYKKGDYAYMNEVLGISQNKD